MPVKGEKHRVEHRFFQRTVRERYPSSFPQEPEMGHGAHRGWETVIDDLREVLLPKVLERGVGERPHRLQDCVDPVGASGIFGVEAAHSLHHALAQALEVRFASSAGTFWRSFEGPFWCMFWDFSCFVSQGNA